MHIVVEGHEIAPSGLGSIELGAPQPPKPRVSAFPGTSTASQNVLVGHDTPIGDPLLSTRVPALQLPENANALPTASSAWQLVVAGAHEIAEKPPPPAATRAPQVLPAYGKAKPMSSAATQA